MVLTGTTDPPSRSRRGGRPSSNWQDIALADCLGSRTEASAKNWVSTPSGPAFRFSHHNARLTGTTRGDMPCRAPMERPWFPVKPMPPCVGEVYGDRVACPGGPGRRVAPWFFHHNARRSLTE